MITISFYLLKPKAAGSSPLYVTITSKQEPRERFATGKSFIASYCNIRPTKGSKDLVKRGTPFTLNYTTTLTAIRDRLLLIEDALEKSGEPCTLKDIRREYEKTLPKESKKDIKPVNAIDALFADFIQYEGKEWSEGFRTIVTKAGDHFNEYNKGRQTPIDLASFDVNDWNGLKEYFAALELDNATINKNLKQIKRFLKYAGKDTPERKAVVKTIANVNDWKPYKTLKPFKISLKDYEVDGLLSLDKELSEPQRIARDLVMLEVFTGQRFSDVDKLLDRKHYDGKSIRIHQQKGGGLISIPIHAKLESHLERILSRYPKGLPTMSIHKVNEHIKEVGRLAGLTKTHQWTTMSGTTRTQETAKRYELITTHTGRRTFCTLSKNKGIGDQFIMKVTGHQNYAQYLDYIHVDDEDIEKEYTAKF